MVENKDMENEDVEFQSGNFLSASQLDRAVLVISKAGILNTRFGERKYIADGSNIVLINKTMEKKFIELGYKSAKKLIGKTVYLNAVPVMVQGQMKKMWMVEKVE